MVDVLDRVVADGVRVVAQLGPPGCGKTTIAAAWARRPDVAVVDLDDFAEADPSARGARYRQFTRMYAAALAATRTHRHVVVAIGGLRLAHVRAFADFARANALAFGFVAPREITAGASATERACLRLWSFYGAVSRDCAVAGRFWRARADALAYATATFPDLPAADDPAFGGGAVYTYDALTMTRDAPAPVVDACAIVAAAKNSEGLLRQIRESIGVSSGRRRLN